MKTLTDILEFVKTGKIKKPVNAPKFITVGKGGSLYFYSFKAQTIEEVEFVAFIKEKRAFKEVSIHFIDGNGEQHSLIFRDRDNAEMRPNKTSMYVTWTGLAHNLTVVLGTSEEEVRDFCIKNNQILK